MANTATKVYASKHRLVYLLTGDGTVGGPTIANATLLTDSAGSGPLYDALNAEYANQAAMRAALLAGNSVRMWTQLRETGVDVTAEKNQVTVDVDVDGVTAEKAEINCGMSDTTGQVAYLFIEHCHSLTS